jgi:hypothetical protein
MIFDVVPKDRIEVLNEGIGLSSLAGDIVGTFTVDNVDEEIAAGTLSRAGFFDRISTGDALILPGEGKKDETPESARANPELRRLLRTLR